jgi:hypothetical protein
MVSIKTELLFELLAHHNITNGLKKYDVMLVEHIFTLIALKLKQLLTMNQKTTTTDMIMELISLLVKKQRKKLNVKKQSLK